MTPEETVWIVDDDRSIRWVLEKTLEQEGIQCRLFDSAENLVNLIDKEQPSAIAWCAKSALSIMARVYPRRF